MSFFPKVFDIGADHDDRAGPKLVKSKCLVPETKHETEVCAQRSIKECSVSISIENLKPKVGC